METLVCSAGGVMGAVPLEEAKKHLDDPQTLVWMDFNGKLTAADEDLLRQMFGFHDLALEDASKPADGAIRRQRPKVEEYDDYFFLVMQALTANRDGGLLKFETHEIDLFVGANYVVSVHREDLPEIAGVWNDAQKRPGLMSCGSDRLAYHILDAVVDRYIDTVDDIEDLLDDLEDAVIDPKAGRDAVHNIFDFKRELISFRKSANPLREAINEMTSRDFPHIKPDTLPYLRDVYDHLIRLSDMLDSYRDILSGALDVHLSAVSNSMNLVMKRLTVVATIFLPLNFITGFWGMNFQELPVDNVFFWWGSLTLMSVLTLATVFYMTRSWMRKW